MRWKTFWSNVNGDSGKMNTDSGNRQESVHLQPEFMFTFNQNGCSRSARIGVHLGSEYASRKLMTELGKNPSVPATDSPCFEIALVSEDVPAALSRALAAGASLVQDVEEMPWGQTTAYVRDLDGFLVELCTPIVM